MLNTQINRIATTQIAKALGDLNNQVIYVGGAVVSLYIDDPAADDVRPTKDVDIGFDIVSIGHLEDIREALLDRGFYQSYEDKVVCRFRYEDKKIDIMSTQEVGWAPANRWFKEGYNNAFNYLLEQVSIKLMPLPYFLASKFDAFSNRGGFDPRMSHDFEDIVYLLNYTSNISTQINLTDKPVQDFLKKSFRDIIDNDTKKEAILGNLYHENQTARFKRIITMLQQIVNV